VCSSDLRVKLENQSVYFDQKELSTPILISQESTAE